LIISVLGVYSTMSQIVEARRREIGIRLAIGARSHDIRALIAGWGARVLLAGAALGALAGVAAGRLVAVQAKGVVPVDWLVQSVSVALVVLAGMIALARPVRRASRVDPVNAIRGS
jgi:ABC-type antimicrobial peptide transport system permease subunit